MAKRTTIEEFIEQANYVHNNFYKDGMGEVKYVNRKTKVTIICPVHGRFEISPRHFIGRGHGCIKCHRSKGEVEIERWLQQNNIKYKTQYRFKDCKGIKWSLPFDFFLTDSEICIEYDGVGHFKIIRWKGINDQTALKRFKATKQSDQNKTDYCKLHKIKLLRISYQQFDKIPQILKRKIKY